MFFISRRGNSLVKVLKVKKEGGRLLRTAYGVTILELIIVAALIVILALVSILNLSRRRPITEIDATARQIAALLREAQSRSVSQAEGASWGVHFENSTTTAPFYALFRSSYSLNNRLGYYSLPSTVGYASSSVPTGGTKEVIFSQVSGAASASTSVKIILLADPAVSSTIYVASSGAVRF